MSLNKSVNFWDGSVNSSFTDFKGLGASILSKCSDAKNRIKARIAESGNETNQKLSLEIKQQVSEMKTNRTDLESTVVDSSAFTIPTIVQNGSKSLEEAYKEAYENQAKACHEMELRAVKTIRDLKEENEQVCSMAESYTEKGLAMHRQQVESAIQGENSASFMGTGGSKMRNEYINLMKSIRQNKPPAFVIEGSTPSSFLVYLNDDFSEYCDEMLLENMDEKCFVLQKLFTGTDIRHENFRKKIKIFFSTDKIRQGLADKSMSETNIYSNLVQYLYSLKASSAKLDKRKKGCCWIIYFKQLWTLKTYCDVVESEIGQTILSELFTNTDLLNTNNTDLLKEFKKQFYIDVMTCGNHISQDRVTKFAMEMDALYPDSESTLSINTFDGPKTNVKSDTERIMEQLNTLQVNQRNFSSQRNASDSQNNNRNRTGFRSQYTQVCFNCGEEGHRLQTCAKSPANCGKCKGTRHLDKFCDDLKQINEAMERKYGNNNSNSNRNSNFSSNNRGNYSNNSNNNNGGNDNRNFSGNWRNQNNNSNSNRNFSERNDTGRNNHHSNQSCDNTNNNDRPFQSKKLDAQVKEFGVMSINTADMSMSFDKNGDLRKFVSVSIEDGIPQKSLCDTGASASGIDAGLLQEYGITDLIKSKPDMVKMANGELTPSMGTIDIKCTIEGSNQDVTFAVISTLSPKIILGAPLLKSVGVMDKFEQDIDRAFKSSKN